VARAEAGSLAAALADAAGGTPADAGGPDGAGVDPAGQVPHWLFAFDAVRITAMRTLALLGSDPARRAAAAADVAPVLPYLRACVLDTVRLWPTTLVVLRESTRDTDWDGIALPRRTTFVVPSSFHHRDPAATPHADEFSPEQWLDGTARSDWSVFPFSAGPAVCPGRDVVLLTVSTVLAALLRRFPALQTAPPLAAPLPYTLDHTGLRLALG
jgi:cytochrome P450